MPVGSTRMSDSVELAPNPIDQRLLTYEQLALGSLLHRVHGDAFASTAGNPTASLYRFSPVFTERNTIVPVLYAGATEHCAFMETVLRGVSMGKSKALRASTIEDRVYSTVVTTQTLKLVSLDATALARFGQQLHQVVHTSAEFYRNTSSWAQVIYRADKTVQGLSWPSHRASPATAYMLYCDRLDANTLQAGAINAQSILHDMDGWERLKISAYRASPTLKIPDFRKLP